jgi:cell division protease FtsH
MGDLHDALEKLVLGTARRIMLSPAERTRTAHHEAGHALVGMLTPGADPVRKIAIIPRGQALGVTLSTPETDRYNYAREDLLGKIKVALGGRAAERLVFGDLTTGAESDIQNLTQIARGMVGRWGMSEAIGPVAVTDGRSDGALLPGVSPTSAATQQLVDEEVRRIIDDAEHDVLLLLERERERLDRLTHTLLERETLDGADAYHAAGLSPPNLDAEDEAHATIAAPVATDLPREDDDEAPAPAR